MTDHTATVRVIVGLEAAADQMRSQATVAVGSDYREALAGHIKSIEAGAALLAAYADYAQKMDAAFKAFEK